MRFTPGPLRQNFQRLFKLIQSTAVGATSLLCLSPAGTLQMGTDGVTSSTAGSWVKPKFCKNLDCPRFEIVKKTEDYQVRLYDASHWVSTSLDSINYSDATGKMFMRLFRYIDGNNQQDKKIAMTCPVLNRVVPVQGPACENTFTMSFFLDPSQLPAPSPRDETVFLSSQPKQKVYVKSFGGFAKQEDFLKAVTELAENLSSDEEYHTDFWYTVGYDSPYQLENRHNEVWLIAK